MDNNIADTAAVSAADAFNGDFTWSDPFSLALDLSSDERQVAEITADYANSKLLPAIVTANREHKFARSIMRDMGELGLFGAVLPEKFGGSEMGYVAYGLIARELEKIDSSYRSVLSVQSSLAMQAIFMFGDDEQKSKYLPDLASGKLIGCFGLTEPDYGSDPGGMVTVATKTDGGYLLSGSKAWITNSPIADVLIVWAKSEAHDNKVCGFIVERDTPGVEAPVINGKMALCASITGMIHLDQAFVAEKNILPHALGLKSPFACLNRARYSIAWGAMGAAEFCWQASVDYVIQRKQFGKPLAANQLIQKKLADMQTEIALGLTAAARVGRLMERGQASHEMISLIKRNNSGKALTIARDARDMHGANGISDEYHVMRHLVNLEAVNTYEGTHDIHALILGRSQTDIAAFG